MCKWAQYLGGKETYDVRNLYKVNKLYRIYILPSENTPGTIDCEEGRIRPVMSNNFRNYFKVIENLNE